MTYGATRNEIIERSLRQIGVLGRDQNPDGYQVDKAQRALNGIIKHLDLGNDFVWKTLTTTFNTVAATASYTPATGVVGLHEALIRVSDLDDPLIKMTYEDYYSNVLEKTSTGKPTHIVWKDHPSTPSIILWPVPDAIYAVHYLGVYKLDDYTSAGATALVPSHWEEVITWMLAAALSHEYGLPLDERMMLEQKANNLYEKARLDNFNHRGSGEIYFEPQ